MEKYTNALSKVVMSVATDAVNNFTAFIRDAEDCSLNDEQKMWMESMAKRYLESFGKKPTPATKGKTKAPVEVVAMVEDSPPPAAVQQDVEKQPVEKTKRAPSRYNNFVKEHIPLVKAEHPQLSHKEVMKIVIGLWKESNADEQPAGSSSSHVIEEKAEASDTQAPEAVAEKKEATKTTKKKKEPEAPVADDSETDGKKTAKRAASSEYNTFIKDIIPKLKKEFPDFKKTELMDMANERWKEQQH
jgi:hypothetical protein